MEMLGATDVRLVSGFSGCRCLPAVLGFGFGVFSTRTSMKADGYIEDDLVSCLVNPGTRSKLQAMKDQGPLTARSSPSEEEAKDNDEGDSKQTSNDSTNDFTSWRCPCTVVIRRYRIAYVALH